VWRALRGLDDDGLARRALVAGVSVCVSDALGAGKDGEKNFRDIALWLGRNFGIRGELGLRGGAWGIDRLAELPIFTFDGDVLDLPLTDEVDGFLNEVIRSGAENNPLLSPLASEPEPWTQVRRGGLPADHWARVPLIREHHASIEAAARKAIGTGRMQPVLDTVNALQRVPFTINVPVLDFMLRSPPPRLGPKPPAWQREEFEEWQKTRSRSLSWHMDMLTAEAMACLDRFWVPLNIDFRGRVYGIPHF